jgi:hypothetical protein
MYEPGHGQSKERARQSGIKEYTELVFVGICVARILAAGVQESNFGNLGTKRPRIERSS